VGLDVRVCVFVCSSVQVFKCSCVHVCVCVCVCVAGIGIGVAVAVVGLCIWWRRRKAKAVELNRQRLLKVSTLFSRSSCFLAPSKEFYLPGKTEIFSRLARDGVHRFSEILKD